MALIQCSECGASVSDKSSSCPSCGYPISTYQNTVNATQQFQVSSVDMKPSFGYAFLGFLIPIVGLVLFLVWGTTKPGPAKSAGKGALVSVILWVLFYVVIAGVAMSSY